MSIIVYTLALTVCLNPSDGRLLVDYRGSKIKNYYTFLKLKSACLIKSDCISN